MKRRDLFTRFVTTAKVVLSAEVYNGEIEEIMGCISQSLQEPELEVQRQVHPAYLFALCCSLRQLNPVTQDIQ